MAFGAVPGPRLAHREGAMNYDGDGSAVLWRAVAVTIALAMVAGLVLLWGRLGVMG